MNDNNIKFCVEKSSYMQMTEEEFMLKLETSRQHASEGRLKKASYVISKLRSTLDQRQISNSKCSDYFVI